MTVLRRSTEIDPSTHFPFYCNNFKDIPTSAATTPSPSNRQPRVWGPQAFTRTGKVQNDVRAGYPSLPNRWLKHNTVLLEVHARVCGCFVCRFYGVVCNSRRLNGGPDELSKCPSPDAARTWAFQRGLELAIVERGDVRIHYEYGKLGARAVLEALQPATWLQVFRGAGSAGPGHHGAKAPWTRGLPHFPWMWGLPEENEKHDDGHCCQQGGGDDEAGELISTGQGKSYHGEYCRRLSVFFLSISLL